MGGRGPGRLRRRSGGGSAEEEERLRANVVRRNSLREDGSETDATEVLVETVGGNAGNESVADRVRRLEEGQGGQG